MASRARCTGTGNSSRATARWLAMRSASLPPKPCSRKSQPEVNVSVSCCQPQQGEVRLRVVPLSPFLLAVAARLPRSEEHTSELQSQSNLVCRLLLEKKKKQDNSITSWVLRTTQGEHRKALTSMCSDELAARLLQAGLE